MSNDIIQLMIDGVKHTGWKSIRVNRSVDSLCGKFSMTLITPKITAMPEIVPGAPAMVMIGTDRAINGYLDGIDISLSSGDAGISVSGRDRTEDLVDCSCTIAPGSWQKKTLYQMAKTLCQPFGINVKYTLGIADPAEEFTLQIGESPFDVLSRAAKDRGLLLITYMPSADLYIASPGSNKTNDSLVYGKNIKSIDFGYEYANRFAKYVVKGQRSSGGDGWGQSTTYIKGEATDQNIRSARVKMIQAETQATSASVSKRAQYEAIVRAAQAENMTVTVVGYRQSNGDLWKENMLVDVSTTEGIIKIEGEYLISEVEYSIGDEGKITKMTLKRKDAYAPVPTVKKTKAQGLVWR